LIKLYLMGDCYRWDGGVLGLGADVLTVVLCVSEGAQQRASRYCIVCSRAAAASERRVLPLGEVADVSVSHDGMPAAAARRSRSGQDSPWDE